VDSGVRLLRFDRVQRGVHWVNAALFGVLMFTGIPLYFGSFFGVLFERHVIQEIHLWCGLALPLPILVSLLGPWGQRMRRDVRRLSYWTKAEVRWLRTGGRTSIELDKFNPGQKANAIFIAGVIVIMWATGYILQWFRFFPVTWRQGATLTHDVFAFAIFAVVLGHITMAIAHPEAMGSMFRGTVSRPWAQRHAAAWSKEESAPNS
jgi:formate dehydrogenase subunit gamma